MNLQFKNLPKFILPAIFAFAFFALAGEARAAVYYVKPASQGGSDSYTGLSDAQAWATVGKVKSAVTAPGSDVYFKRGGNWSRVQLIIDWGGSSGDFATIGAYGSGAMPIIDDGADPETLTGGNLPLKAYTGAVSITSDYVKIENIKVQNSGAFGIRFENTSFGVVDRCETNNTFMSGISSASGSDHITITNCDVLYPAQIKRLGYEGPWPAGLAIINTDYATVKYTNVFWSGNEGLGFYKGTEHSEASYNVVMNSSSYSLYMDRSSYCTMKYNLVYGTEISEWWSAYPSYCMVMGDEKLDYISTDNTFIGNLLAGCRTGLHFQQPIDGSTNTINNAKIFNNIIINSSDFAVRFGTNISLDAETQIRNNIFLCNDEIDGCTSKMNNQNKSSALGKFDYNYWSYPPGANLRGAHDKNGTPGLKVTNGWTKALLSPGMTGEQFAILGTSQLKNTGDQNIGDDYRFLLDLDASNFAAGCGVSGNGPLSFALADQDTNGSGWDIGADVYVSGDTQAPAMPSGLSVK